MRISWARVQSVEIPVAGDLSNFLCNLIYELKNDNTPKKQKDTNTQLGYEIVKLSLTRMNFLFC